MEILSEKELNRYSIALRDFEKAEKYIGVGKKYPRSSIEYEALLFAAIVSYYRPFSPNEKSESAKATSRLSIKEFGDLTGPENLLHEKLKALRNKALAHSEFNLNPTKLKPGTQVFSGKPFSLLNENIDLETFDAIFTRFIDICHNRRADFSLHGQ